MFMKYYDKMMRNIKAPGFDERQIPSNWLNQYNTLLNGELTSKEQNKALDKLIKEIEHALIAQRINPSLKERAANTQRFLDAIKIKLK